VPSFLKAEELDAEVVVLRTTLGQLAYEQASAEANLEQHLNGLRQYLSEQLEGAEQQWHALHQQLADERSRMYGYLHGQIQRVRSPLQIGLSLFSPAIARENLRALQANKQALVRPTPQEQWLLGQIAQVEGQIQALRRELAQPRDTPQMQELRRRIAWLTSERQRLQVQADRLAARADALRQQPRPLPQAPAQGRQTVNAQPVGIGHRMPGATRECWHCQQQIVVTPRGLCPQCGAPIMPVP
jgi:chromosome segregation ATPase